MAVDLITTIIYMSLASTENVVVNVSIWMQLSYTIINRSEMKKGKSCCASIHNLAFHWMVIAIISIMLEYLNPHKKY